MLEQKVLRKYGGLKFVDPDLGKEFTVHQDQMSFEKEKTKNRYELFCILDGFDDIINDEDRSDLYELWCCNLVIDKIVEYYELHDNEGVVIYKKGDILIAVMARGKRHGCLNYLLFFLYGSNLMVFGCLAVWKKPNYIKNAWKSDH